MTDPRAGGITLLDPRPTGGRIEVARTATGPLYLSSGVMHVGPPRLAFQRIQELHRRAVGERTGFELVVPERLTVTAAFGVFSQASLLAVGQFVQSPRRVRAGLLTGLLAYAEDSGSLAGLESFFATAVCDAVRLGNGPLAASAAEVLARVGLPDQLGGGARTTVVVSGSQLALPGAEALAAALGGADRRGSAADVLGQWTVGGGLAGLFGGPSWDGSRVDSPGADAVGRDTGKDSGIDPVVIGTVVGGIAGAIVGVGLTLWSGPGTILGGLAGAADGAQVGGLAGAGVALLYEALAGAEPDAGGPDPSDSGGDGSGGDGSGGDGGGDGGDDGGGGEPSDGGGDPPAPDPDEYVDPDATGGGGATGTIPARMLTGPGLAGLVLSAGPGRYTMMVGRPAGIDQGGAVDGALDLLRTTIARDELIRTIGEPAGFGAPLGPPRTPGNVDPAEPGVPGLP